MRFAIIALLLLGQGCVSQARQQRAQARADLGAVLLDEGSTEQAIATLQEATELDPRNIDAWNQLGLALMKRGEADEAERSFKRGLRLDDENASINLNYAFLLLKQDRAPEAIERLEVALHDFTYRQPAMVLNSLGYAYYTQGRYGQAVAKLREAVLRAPHYCQAWYNLGLAFEGQQSPAEAIDAYDHVVMICSTEAAGSYFRAAMLMLATDRDAEGEQYLRRVCGQWPGSEICTQARSEMESRGIEAIQ